MKKIVLFLIGISLLAFNGIAQDKAIEPIDLNATKSRYFIAPIASFEDVNGETFVSFGAKFGRVINKSFSIGIYGQTFINDKPIPKTIDRFFDAELDLTLLGGFLEYTYKSHKAVHLTFPVNFGWGRVNLESENDNFFNNVERRLSGNGGTGPKEYGNFFYIEPGLGLELNLNKQVRFFTVASYRFTNHLEYSFVDYNIFTGDPIYNSINSSDMRGLMGTIGLKIGIF